MIERKFEETFDDERITTTSLAKKSNQLEAHEADIPYCAIRSWYGVGINLVITSLSFEGPLGDAFDS